MFVGVDQSCALGGIEKHGGELGGLAEFEERTDVAGCDLAIERMVEAFAGVNFAVVNVDRGKEQLSVVGGEPKRHGVEGLFGAVVEEHAGAESAVFLLRFLSWFRTWLELEDREAVRPVLGDRFPRSVRQAAFIEPTEVGDGRHERGFKLADFDDLQWWIGARSVKSFCDFIIASARAAVGLGKPRFVMSLKKSG